MRYGQSENTWRHGQQESQDKYYVNRPRSVRRSLQSYHQTSQYTESRPSHHSLDKDVQHDGGETSADLHQVARGEGLGRQKGRGGQLKETCQGGEDYLLW